MSKTEDRSKEENESRKEAYEKPALVKYSKARKMTVVIGQSTITTA